MEHKRIASGITEQELDRIADHLVTIAGSGPNPVPVSTFGHDDLLLERYKQAAQGCMTAFPTKAHAILAAVATLRRQEDRMRTHFRVAMQCDPLDVVVQINYVAALQDFACLSEAADAARAHHGALNCHRELLKQYVESAVFAGRFQEACQCLTSKPHAAYLQREVEWFEQVRLCAGFLASLGVTDEATEGLQRKSSQCLRAAGLPVRKIGISLEPHDHAFQYRVRFHWFLVASPETRDRLTRQFVAGLTADEVFIRESYIMMGYESLPHH